MKDFLLINIFSKNESSYNNYYTHEIEKNNMSYDVIYFERYNMEETAGENEYVFKEYCPTGGNNFKKIGTMFRLAQYIRSIINSNKYKKLIVFTSVPAIMIFDILLRKYKNNYILDIRDYTHESNKFYYQMEKNIIDNSFCTVISSKGFLSFLPESSKYTLTHNIMEDSYVPRKIDLLHKNHLSIGYVGSIRYYNANTLLMDQLKNDNSYSLDYYGTFSQNCNLQEYADNNSIENVSFHGRYINSDKAMIYQGIDIINSVYGTESLETTTLTPNRLYDGALYGCPIIVSKHTYLEELVKEYKLGFAVDLNKDNLKELLEKYIAEFNEEEFNTNRQLFLKKVYSDMDKQKQMIQSFCEQ